MRGFLRASGIERAAFGNRGISENALSIDFDQVPDHKTAGPDRRASPVCLSRSMWCGGLGECPEWQRGRTVNPLAYAFVGSSPTSPTSLRPLRGLWPGKPADF